MSSEFSHEIRPTVIPNGWRAFSFRRDDKNFLPFYQRVLDRDKHTCYYCGFKAKKYMEVVNLDGNYFNNILTNLVTSCGFCSQCFFLEVVGKYDNSGGRMIYLPEISQVNLNGLCHVLFCAIANSTDYLLEAQEVYKFFKSRAKMVENFLGQGMSDPSLLGNMLLNEQAKVRQKIQKEIFDSVRLLPSYSSFRTQVDRLFDEAMKGTLFT